jgi:hypothetical protein
MGHKKIAQDKMKNKKYHTVGTIQKYHTVGTIQKYHTVGTIQKYHTVGTIPQSNIQIVERGSIGTRNSQIHDRSFSCSYIYPLSEMRWSCKCFHVPISTLLVK